MENGSKSSVLEVSMNTGIRRSSVGRIIHDLNRAKRKTTCLFGYRCNLG